MSHNKKHGNLVHDNRKFGEIIKEIRIQNGLTLREFCRSTNIQAPYMSRLERGVINPPKGEKVIQILKHFNIDPDSTLGYLLIIKASTERGIIPNNIMSDKDLCGKLPLLFNSLSLDKDKLIELAEEIRRVNSDS